MLINKRLLDILSESKKYIAINVLVQWLNLLMNIVAILVIAKLIDYGYRGLATWHMMKLAAVVIFCAVLVRFAATVASSRLGYLSSKNVKVVLREKIMNKMLTLGAGYKEKIATSEVVQVAVEGVEQLETYFGAYLPQLFYAMVAPITLFIVIAFMSVWPATILLVCVPLIPISIALVQTFAKRLFAEYWGKYSNLGDTFLENLQGLTTLKIYQADEYKNAKMNNDAEQFRKITMRVLSMQLNSITVMDLVAYGGAALGIAVAIGELNAGKITLFHGIAIVMLSADFFIPMRLLGSFFHITMNGIAASEKIFRILDLPDENKGVSPMPCDENIRLENVSFSYDGNTNVLTDISLNWDKKGLIAIVGHSGSGKSTIAGILMKAHGNYNGKIHVGSKDFQEISEASVMEHITYIGHNSYIFRGSVRSNLAMASPDATEDRMWEVLEQASLADLFQNENGLDTVIAEGGMNLSGGQRQRLALARGLIRDTQLYIFDETTSNIDVESEEAVLHQIYKLSESKGVMMISHRLANVVDAEKIYVLDKGYIKEEGTHKELLAKGQDYFQMWEPQENLEKIRYKEVLCD